MSAEFVMRLSGAIAAVVSLACVVHTPAVLAQMARPLKRSTIVTVDPRPLAETTEMKAQREAADRVRCEQYVRRAMASVDDAAQNICALTSNPAYWSQNQRDHYDHCMKGPEAATQAQQARETALQDCKAANRARCEQYVRQAMASVDDAARITCAPTSNPAYWSQNQTEHYNYCMKSPLAVATQAEKARETELQVCKDRAKKEEEAANRARCEQYAQQAMDSVFDAARIACAPTSNPAYWSQNQTEHYNYCMKSTLAVATQAQKARDTELQVCKKCENGTVFEQLRCKFDGLLKPAPTKS